MPKCHTCGTDAKELSTVLTALDLLKIVVTTLAHDPAFKENGGIRVPADQVALVKEKGLQFLIRADKGEIWCIAIDPKPLIHLPGNDRVM